jgi:hypothetical protein
VRKHWKAIVIAVMVTVVGLSVVAAAYGTTRSTRKANRAFAGACAQLMSNPQAVQDMQALRVEHQKDMQAWWSQYGSDPTSDAAKAALKALRTEHWNDMKALFGKYGIKVPANAGPGSLGGFGMMGGQYGGCGTGGAGCGGVGTGTNTGAGSGGMMGGGMMGGYTY